MSTTIKNIFKLLLWSDYMKSRQKPVSINTTINITVLHYYFKLLALKMLL